jgi:hypothetical protein
VNATGLFFLTARPSLAQLQSSDDGPVRAWAFPMLERTRRGTQHVIAYWDGVDAARFIQIHQARLKKGQALRLTLDRLRPANDGLQGHIVACELAPDRWPGYAVEPRIDSPSLPRPLGASLSPTTQRNVQ